MAWWQAGAAAAAIFALVAVAIFVSLTEKRYDLVSHRIDVQVRLLMCWPHMSWRLPSASNACML